MRGVGVKKKERKKKNPAIGYTDLKTPPGAAVEHHLMPGSARAEEKYVVVSCTEEEGNLT